MRKRHLIFILLLTSVMITSCMTTRSTSKIQQVQVGMNKTVIKKMLGTPYYRHGDEMGEQWEYEKEVGDVLEPKLVRFIVVFDADDKVVRYSTIPMHPHPYHK